MGEPVISDVEALNLSRDTFIAVMSARKTGKSYLLAELIQYFLTNESNKVDYVYMFSETAGMDTGTNDQYSFFDKKAIIHPDRMNVVIPKLFASQKATNFRFKILVVFDDISMTKRYAIIENLASMGRHYGITVIFSAQISNTAVSPTIRKNISYLIWRRLSRDDLKNNIYPVVGIHPFFSRSEDLWVYTKDNIKDYQFLFFNNNEDINDSTIKIIRAKPINEGFRYAVHVPQSKARASKQYNKSESFFRTDRF